MRYLILDTWMDVKNDQWPLCFCEKTERKRTVGELIYNTLFLRLPKEPLLVVCLRLGRPPIRVDTVSKSHEK